VQNWTCPQLQHTHFAGSASTMATNAYGIMFNFCSYKLNIPYIWAQYVAYWFHCGVGGIEPNVLRVKVGLKLGYG